MHYGDVNESGSVYSSVAMRTRMRYYIHRPLPSRWCTSWNLSEALVGPARQTAKKKAGSPIVCQRTKFSREICMIFARAFKQCGSTAETARGITSLRVSSQVSLNFNLHKEHSNRSSECLRRFRYAKSATRIDTLSDTERIKRFAELGLWNALDSQSNFSRF